jgi:hypothetical protein
VRTLLDGLVGRVDPKAALVLPVFQDFRPSKPAWDDLVGRVQKEVPVRVDVFGFLRAFGPVPDMLLGDVWGVLRYLDESEDALSQEGAIRTRAFMDSADRSYDKVVLFAYGPTMSTWTAGAIGSPASKKTEIVRLRSEYDGYSDPRLHKRFCKVLSDVRGGF